MYNHLLYLLYWIINFSIVFLASNFFPGGVEAGTWKFTSLEAAIYGGFWITFFVWAMWDLALARRVKTDDSYSSFIYFWFANALGIWLVTRIPDITGLGIARFTWAIALGLVAAFIQRWVRGLVFTR